MTVPTFTQELRRKDRQADLEGVLETLERLRKSLAALKNAKLGDVADLLDSVDEDAEQLEIEVTDYIALADYEPDYKALAEGCGRMVDSVRMGLFDEPKTVPEFAMNLDELMRDTRMF